MASVVSSAKAEYSDALELCGTQLQPFVARMETAFQQQRRDVFGLQSTCDRLQAALQAELALPSPTKVRPERTKKQTARDDLVRELQQLHSKHRSALQAIADRFGSVTLTLPGAWWW